MVEEKVKEEKALEKSAEKSILKKEKKTNEKDEKSKCKILDNLKKLKEKYKEFKGVNLIVISIIVLVVVGMIVFSSMKYNGSNLVWDLSRVNEDVGTFAETSINDVLLDFGFTLAIILIGYSLFGSIKISMVISCTLWTIINIVNDVLMQLRGTAFAFSDIFSAGTALSVVNGMEVNFQKDLMAYVLINIIVVILLMLIKFKKLDTKKKRVISRISNLAFAVVIFVVCMNTPKYKRLNYWDLDTQYKDNGIQMVFVKQIDDFFLSKPEGYSIKKVEEILSRYDKKVEEINKANENKEKTNVIIIMNESFADLKTTYNLEMEDNLPYFKSLKENTIKGTLYSSVLGGGTATAEWELLTGNSSAFLPTGAIPYIVYVRDNKETMVSNFRLNGYETVGMHSYYGKCYNRRTSYSRMGFDKGIFMDDMQGIWFSKSNHPSDEASYKKLIESYESRNKEKNFFGFLLTMQSHAPYTFENYNNKGYVKDNSRLDQYLSLIKDADDALKGLIEYFKNVDEKTIILLFGDHQPKIASELTQDEWLKTQKVPYMLWANYDIEEKDGKDISTNYLCTMLYEYSGIDTTNYVEFLKDFNEKVPVFTSKGYKDKDEKTYEVDDESQYVDMINEYKILQYYYMFDNNIK